MLISAPYVCVTGVFLTKDQTAAGAFTVAFTCVCILACGLVCRFRPDVMPDFFWIAVPFLAAGVISGLNVITNDATTGAQLFYLWPVFYSANFLSRPVVYANLVAVLIGEGLVVAVALKTENAMSDWVAMTLAMSMTAFVVLSLRERGDQLLRRLEGQALADPLTGLSNRRFFDEELDRAGQWATRTGRPLALVTVDLDHFKGINDTYGHAVGDQALQAVATAMRSVGEQDDVMARLGGDEFVMLLRADLRGALRTTETLRDAVAAVTDLPCGAPRLSIGVAILPDHAVTVDELAKASDAALYQAKSRGRGQVAVAGIRRDHATRQNVDQLPSTGPPSTTAPTPSSTTAPTPPGTTAPTPPGTTAPTPPGTTAPTPPGTTAPAHSTATSRSKPDDPLPGDRGDTHRFGSGSPDRDGPTADGPDAGRPVGDRSGVEGSGLDVQRR